MSKVYKLDSNTINKIAAGEVVERPASVVKELVENSIDAGADIIEIEIQNGGKSLIRISDNGSGMNMEDACLSICRHATSKIKNADDLNEISTLGFRGEALSSIMSVSNFTMRTKTEDTEHGTFIHCDGGINQDVHETDLPLGTNILVENLFFNTPARKKFLKTTNTEGAKIHDYIVKLALSRPSIKFKFINGNRNAINTPGNGNIFDTILSIYGKEIADSLLEIDFVDKNSDDFSIKGYISKPNVLKSYRNWQTFIVNGRIVANRIIAKAVDEAYKAMIPKSGYPLAILILNLPANSIDVNVHPQKTEIRFEDEGKIYRAIYAAVKQAIEEKNFSQSEIEDELTAIAVKPTFMPKSPQSVPAQRSFDLSKTREILKNYKERQSNEELNFEMPIPPPQKISVDEKIEFEQNEIEDKKNISESNDTNETKLSPIGQVDLCYIIAKSGHDLYIIDQHAAHERILFDRLSGYTDAIPAQQLLIHQILQFDEHESQIIEKNLELFHKLGFTMESSGKNEYRLMEVPTDIESGDFENILREILSNLPPTDEIEEENRSEEIAKNIRQACLAMTACKAAIKAGQELNFRQMQIILDQLSKTAHPYTCPHGRPTILKFTSHDLAKMFKRTGF